MVEGHTVADAGLTWTMRLRDGLRFHDNTPVLARDVIASLRRWGVRGTFGISLMADVNELSAPDVRFAPLALTPAARDKTARIQSNTNRSPEH